MSAATLIYPHQLFKQHPAIAQNRIVYLVEEPLILTFNPIHNAKLVLHKLSMDAYQQLLVEKGLRVKRLSLDNIASTNDAFNHLKTDKISEIHVADTTDYYLENALETSGLTRISYDSPYFLLTKQEASSRYRNSNKFMANFYKQLRKDMDILMQGGRPLGGKWSFDEDNRKKIPKSKEIPQDIQFTNSSNIDAAAKWASAQNAERYGDAVCWLPYTHEGAEQYLQSFFEQRFNEFGTYEDAMTTRGTRLWHSAISPLLNIGLLTPKQVIDRCLDYAQHNHVPLNSLEGFVRQIIGWREFIRASYEADGVHMRNRNFWAHTRKLPQTFWTAKTDLPPVDLAIQNALKHGYNHHIERLMVMGNIMLLSEVHPNEVYRWFMAMYIDAYDWVMVPNVYGMSQFADGGSFATKPYISSANYIKKMSDYGGGEWEKTWTGLYWHFINKHIDVFKSNHRLSMMPRLLARMSPETRQAHFQHAQRFFEQFRK